MRAPSMHVKFSQGMLNQHELLSRRGTGWLGGDFSLVLKSFWFLCHVIVSLFQRLNANLRKNSLLCSTQWKLLSQNISFQILFSVHTHTHTHTSFISIILRLCLFFGRKAMTNLDSILKSRDIILPTKVHLVTAMVFPVITYGCESWTIKKAECQRTDAFELWCWRRLLKSPLDCKEIQPVSPRRNQSWIFIGKTDVEAEALVFWPPNVKNWLIGKDPDAGKDWRQKEKVMTEDEMVGWHHRLEGHEFELALGVVMDRETWRVVVHGVAKSRTWLSHWTEQINYRL